MDLKVTLLNILRYSDKQTGAAKIRIGYINNDAKYIENTDKFKGYPELSVFLDDNGLWEKLPFSLIGQVCTFKFKKLPNPRNPLKDITVLEHIECKDTDISIL